MRLLIVFSLLFFFCPNTQAQEGEIFLSTLNGQLFRLDLADCSFDLVTPLAVSTTDISFHPNGNLYAIGSNGQLYEIDITTGASTAIYQFDGTPNEFFTALTISASGVFYATGLSGNLFRYILNGNIGQYLGNIGYGAEGDLTFYEGDLYMASTNDRIVLVDRNNPINSTVAVSGQVPGRIFGIVSYAEDCDSVSVYALTDNAATIYEVNFTTGNLEYYCDIPLQASGGASTFEFRGSNPVFINNLNANGFDCDAATGVLDISASGGVGQLTYSLDGINYQADASFTGLALGDYTVYVSDENGCIRTRPFNGGPVSLIDLIVTNTSCGVANGSIAFNVQGGTAPVNLSLNGNQVPTDETISDLPAGNYTLSLTDAQDCPVNYDIVIDGSTGLELETLEVSPASCELGNGRIDLQFINGSEPYTPFVNNLAITDIQDLQNLTVGNYAIQVTDNDGCTFDTIVIINGTPAVSISLLAATPADCNQSNATATLLTQSGTFPFDYSLNGRPLASADIIDNLSPGDYLLTVSDSIGCQDSLAFMVQSRKCPVYFPNAFSPNFDGVNDFFAPLSLVSSGTNIAYFRVFDRWGGLVFERLNGPLSDRNLRWDGTRLGKPLSAGVYLYDVRLSYPNGSTEDFAGEVNLLR